MKKKENEYVRCKKCNKKIPSFDNGICWAGWGLCDLRTNTTHPICDECHDKKPEKMPGEIYEWEFPEPSRLVIMQRLHDELNGFGATAVLQMAYLSKLRRKAPIVYKRFQEWSVENCKNQWWKEFNIKEGLNAQ